MRKWVIIGMIGSVMLACGLFTTDRTKKKIATDTRFLNLHDTVNYVGMEACRQCHENVYRDFIHTGMGQSFGPATPVKSAADFKGHVAVYDSFSNFYYRPYWAGDSLMIMEYRLDGQDTVHKRTEHVRYVIGSGHHTNSHIVDFNGYLYQAPITFYTQRETWDLAPGFEGGFNSRFQRVIGLECMSCHNGLPDFVHGSENKYHKVRHGIDCERCHGPGELHVNAKLAGHVVDTSRFIDSTIVNPAHLSVPLQMSVCQRCHLQGVAVLQEGRSFEDFRPGMPLRDVMQVFLPQYEGADDRFIMAAHVERLMKSDCFIKSEKLSCITCHNPHISVHQTPVETYNPTCRGCHAGEGAGGCTASKDRLKAKDYNCVECHMPRSGSLDIPHVAITDHRIRVPVDDTSKAAIQRFLVLECLTDPDPAPLTIAKGYLALYEKFSSQRFALDSARKHLQASSADDARKRAVAVQLHYLSGHWLEVTDIVGNAPAGTIQDGWTAYRIGEAYYKQQRYRRAKQFFEQAVGLMPDHPPFQNKLGSTYMQLKEIDAARKTFEAIVRQQRKYVPALSNLGYVYLRLDKPQLAKVLLEDALALDPDYLPAMLNLAGWYVYHEEFDKARKWLKKILEREPAHRPARVALNKLDSITG